MALRYFDNRRPVARVLKRRVRIFPSTIVIGQRSGEGGTCGKGCPPPAIGEGDEGSSPRQF
ncbi:hypothetical protein DPMN_123730 [Dreissena polymorpha]|uniref:Uncharacterized protein n=1 Tax=Dreissena polymorpha TaxID=45954 RepID=A0A9D4JVM0_DREPO|nr:hypothetical protein DPMN_123730 [Dreissena polymorpha]